MINNIAKYKEGCTGSTFFCFKSLASIDPDWKDDTDNNNIDSLARKLYNLSYESTVSDIRRTIRMDIIRRYHEKYT